MSLRHDSNVSWKRWESHRRSKKPGLSRGTPYTSVITNSNGANDSLVNSAPTSLGILGGTFDPPHIGHLILAEIACDALQLDRVLFVVAGNPPHRTVTTSADHRLAMLT